MIKIKEFIILFAPVILMCSLLLGWLFISYTFNFFLVVLYPLYVAVFLGGLAMLKYQHRDYDLVPTDALTLERTFLTYALPIATLILIVIWALRLIAWEILMIPLLLLIVSGMHFTFIHTLLKKRSS